MGARHERTPATERKAIAKTFIDRQDSGAIAQRAQTRMLVEILAKLSDAVNLLIDETGLNHDHVVVRSESQLRTAFEAAIDDGYGDPLEKE